MKDNRCILIVPYLCAWFIISCDSLYIPDEQQNSNQIKITEILNDGAIVLGEKLDNPYSLKNMQRALDTLMATKGMESIELEATDLYVRFRPTDTLQYRLLMDQNIELFDYPLTYDLLSDGDHYHDPSIPEDEITWQYTVVPVDQIDTDVQYEEIDFDVIDENDLPVFHLITDEVAKVSGRIIDACYFPENDIITKSGIGLPVSAEELEAMAIQLSNLPEEYKIIPETKVAEYNPHGYIKFEYIEEGAPKTSGVKGVKVRAQRLLRWSSSFTSSTGYFTIPKKFGSKVNLSIVYENTNDFVIWGNYAFLAPAKYTFKDCITGALIARTLENSQKTKSAWKWAVVNNSAYEYYDYCRTEGISPPPDKLKIWCIKTNGWSSAPMLHQLKGYKIASGITVGIAFLTGNPILASFGAGITALLCIALPDLFIDISSDSYSIIGSNVVHELSHASHYRSVGENMWGRYINYIVLNWGYGDGSSTSEGRYICELGESWAYAHERYLYPGSTSGFSQWFAPCIDAIEVLLEDDDISPSDYFKQLKKGVCNITSVQEPLVEENESAADKINMAFAISGILDSQAQWKIENKTDTCLRVEVLREFYKIDEKLEPGASVIFAGINTSDKNAFYNSYKYDPINKPMGIIISSYDTGRQIYKEKVLSLVVCSTGREMSKPENWHETTEYDHSREITVFTYTIKQTDVAGMKIIGTPIKGGIITI